MTITDLSDSRAIFDQKPNAINPRTALAHRLAPNQATLATPHAFVCDSGEVLWVKSQAQNGLVSELVAGRIGSALSIAPMCHVVDVPPSALLEDGTTQHLEGRNVGTVHLPNCANGKELSRVAPNFDPGTIDVETWVRATIFQTYIDVSDTQVMIDMGTGRIWSIDHGEAFKEAFLSQLPSNVSITMRAVAIGRKSVPLTEQRSAALGIVDEIESLSDDDLLDTVSGVPSGSRWNADDDLRFRMWEVLKARRGGLRKEVDAWTT